MAIYSVQMDTVSKSKRSEGNGTRNVSAGKKSKYILRDGVWVRVELSPESSPDMEANNDQSVADNSKYVMREEHFADRHDDEIVFAGAGNMPKWPKTNPQENVQHYWDAADKYERENGRQARTFIIALPRELTDDQRYELVQKFSAELAQTNDKVPLPFSFAIHQDKENHNPHLHLMISERAHDGLNRNASTWFKRANPKDPSKGGARKTEDLKAKSWLYGARKKWEVACNLALEQANSSARIDCRSLKAQGIDRAPTMHVGTGAYIKNKSELTAHNARVEHNANIARLATLEAQTAGKNTGLARCMSQVHHQVWAIARKPTPYDPKRAKRPRRMHENKPLPINGTTMAWVRYMSNLIDQLTAISLEIAKEEAKLLQLLSESLGHVRYMDEHRDQWIHGKEEFNLNLFARTLHARRQTEKLVSETIPLEHIQQLKARIEASPKLQELGKVAAQEFNAMGIKKQKKLVPLWARGIPTSPFEIEL